MKSETERAIQGRSSLYRRTRTRLETNPYFRFTSAGIVGITANRRSRHTPTCSKKNWRERSMALHHLSHIVPTLPLVTVKWKVGRQPPPTPHLTVTLGIDFVFFLFLIQHMYASRRTIRKNKGK